jgi:hypothetical protein
VPQRFDVDGLFNFGYSGDALLPVQLDVPANAKAGSAVQLAVEARWLVCREECIPGKAMLTLDLPIAAEAAMDSRWQAAFAAARAAQPQSGPWTGVAHERGERIEVTLPGSGADVPSDVALDAFGRTAHRRLRAAANQPRRERADCVVCKERVLLPARRRHSICCSSPAFLEYRARGAHTRRPHAPNPALKESVMNLSDCHRVASVCGVSAPAGPRSRSANSPDFSLTDSNGGKAQTLSQYKGKVVVLEWNNPECPFVCALRQRQHAEAAGRRDAAGAIWLTIVWGAGKQGNLDAAPLQDAYIAKVGEQSKPPTCSIRRHGRRICGARTTPHIYVTDAQGRAALHGRLSIRLAPSTDKDDLPKAAQYVPQVLAELKARQGSQRIDVAIRMRMRKYGS